MLRLISGTVRRCLSHWQCFTVSNTRFANEKGELTDCFDTTTAALAVGLVSAVFVISAGYGALLPQWQGWLALNRGATATAVSHHIGFLSGMYTAGVLVGAPLWGLLADRISLDLPVKP